MHNTAGSRSILFTCSKKQRKRLAVCQRLYIIALRCFWKVNFVFKDIYLPVNGFFYIFYGKQMFIYFTYLFRRVRHIFAKKICVVV